jgi:hypothetical protein
MKTISCIVHFDALGDFDSEKQDCEACWKVWLAKRKDTAKSVRWTFTDNPSQLFKLIPGSDFVFIDYGGLGAAGHESLGRSFARELEKHIVEHPSIEFILLCTMGKFWYEADYAEEHPNLHFEDRYWRCIFDKYFGGVK